MFKGLAAALLAVVLLQSVPAHADGTLYDDLGAKDGVTKIANITIDLAVVNPRIKAKFDNVNLVRLKRLLADQFCSLTGGPCKYEGRSMEESHASLRLTNADFNALVEDLQKAMDQIGVPFSTQNRFLAILAPMQHDVVKK